ncbi:MALTOSE EXCESS PROTEIN 1 CHLOROPLASTIC-RELATED [Salix purpurea]|uniref:MALTOSE EXCESS PROTEIN 1 CHLOROPLASTIC-RELATED n=1 Tax=Salix purpurea TaxID=77065 RepID=A0A9Q0WAH9_SALPP|nr:MALTOSE EXCESS PROTEIN 1 CHLOROPLASTIC-RELATED [Salix purpurea]
MAGDANWVAWKPFVAFLLCEKEGNRGYCCADTGSGFNLRCNCSACNGRSHASALLYGHFSCCSNWLAIKFLELLWNAQCWNLALLGRFYHCLWIVGPSSGYVVYICPIYTKLHFARCNIFCHSSRSCCHGTNWKTLGKKGVKFVGAISGWTATLLFMWMPVSQMWTNFLNPDNIKGLSAFSMLLAMIGNGLMIPRALFIRDFMWFTGSTWAALFYGYGNILCMYYFNSISGKFLLAATAGLVSWIGMALWRDTVVYGYSSPLRSLKELIFGS